MILGFSSLGKPEANLAEIAALVEKYGLDFAELRCLGGSIDLPGYFRRDYSAGGVSESPCAVRLLGSSLRLTEAGEADIRAFIEYALLAERLGARYVRVFGGGKWPEVHGPEAYRHATDVIQSCRREMKERGLKARMLLETHDAFSSSKPCLALNRLLEEPIEILWDSHHTWRLADESPEETVAQLHPWIRHVHYKDSIVNASSLHGYDHVLPGAGEFPTSTLLDLLRNAGFTEGLSLEWEKMWHPELDPLEPALEAFRRVTAR